MSGFFGRLSGKRASTEKVKEKEQKAAAEPSPDDIDIGSPAERGDEPDEEATVTTSHSVTFSSLHNSIIKQRQGVLPHLSQRVWGAWTEDDLSNAKVRGPSYLTDNVKVPCGPSLYTLVHVDIFYRRKDEERTTAATALPDTYLNTPSFAALSATRGEWAKDPAAATVIINLAFPGPRSTNMNCVLYFLRRVPPAELLSKHIEQNPHDDTLVGVDAARVRAFDVTLRRFRQGSDEYRAGKLKIIPRVAEGGYIIKKSIGRVPALLGKKLKMWYRFDEKLNSIEMTADVGSSKVAGKIISLIKTTCEKLVVDMTFLFQGDSGDELPESVLGGVRIAHCNMDKIPHYDNNVELNKQLTKAEGEMAGEVTTQNSGERS